MQFFTSTTGGNASKASWITGVGLIQLDTASLLEKFLSDNDAYGWRLILHSPGRKHGWWTENWGGLIRHARISTLLGQTKKVYG